jgi:hypothetical protein
MKSFWLLFVTLMSLAFAMAQTPAPGSSWRYTLVEGSTITDDCPICGRPTIAFPLRGAFDLVLDNVGPLFTTYRLTNIQFYASPKSAPLYTVIGNGTYRVGGEVSVRQEMLLETEVCNSAPSCRAVTFTNESSAVTLSFPLIEISLVQTQASLFSVYTMHLVAAPVRELWFVITNGFTPTNGGSIVRAGDVLSQSGRIVRSNTRLIESVGITNPLAVLSVDAFDITPGGEILFSMSRGSASPTLGTLREGDLLSDRGRVFKSNQQLTAAFVIQPVVPDVGLDAVHVLGSGEILFSIRTNIFSEAKGVTLHHGDVLSNSGQIVKSNQQLLAKFHPANASTDYGLDALYVWPNGEMWFSTATEFQDAVFGSVSDGDLLSTEGIIVFKNAELVSEFGAPQTISNFGLGDIFVVTDVTAEAPPPHFLPPRIQQNNFLMEWAGTNRVFQLERAPAVTGPWQALSFIDPATSFTDRGTNAQRFYRVRGW